MPCAHFCFGTFCKHSVSISDIECLEFHYADTFFLIYHLPCWKGGGGGASLKRITFPFALSLALHNRERRGGGSSPGPGGSAVSGGGHVSGSQAQAKGQQVPERFSCKHNCSHCLLSTGPSNLVKLVGPLIL